MMPANYYGRIEALAPGEPFIVPGPDRAVASVITARRAAPFTPDQARQLALSQMKREQVNQLLAQRIKDLKAKAKIEYQAGFGTKR
jgi:peptidyl-prolyl cis-trans isomerase C